MIVKSISVSCWRCLLEKVEVGPFTDGLNVIYAPNGTGKSRLFEAMRCALLDGHRVTGVDIEAIRPWRRQLNPKVTVEFVHGGQEYRITKQFLDNPSASLERKENGQYRHLAEGAAADEQTREILTKNPPGRGLAKLEKWGLAQILWAPQGNLAIGPLSTDVVSNIRNTLNAEVSNTSTGPAEKRIEELYLQFFTTKGKLKTGKDAPLLTQLREKLAEATEAQRKAYEQYVAFEDASRRVEEIRVRRAQALDNAKEIEKSLLEARTVADKYGKLVAERNKRSERVTATEARYKELKQRIDLIKSTEAELMQARDSLTALESEAMIKDGEVQKRNKDEAERKVELEDARKGRTSVDAVTALAETARTFNECRRELQRIEELTSKIKKAEKALTDCREKRNAYVAPDARTLSAIRKTIKERDDAQVRIEASLITLEIVPQENGSVEIVAGETPGSIAMKAGVPTQIKGCPEVVADLTHVARLRAWGPPGSVKEYREAQATADQKVKELTEPFGTSDPEALELLAEKAKKLDEALAGADTELKTLLAGGTLNDLLKERGLLESTKKRFLSAHPEWGETPPDAKVLSAQAEETKRAFITRVENAEAAWIQAHEAMSNVHGQKETMSQRLKDTAKQVETLTKKSAELTSDGKTLKVLEEELQPTIMDWDAARASHAETINELNQYNEDPVAVAELLQTQYETANQESNQALVQEVQEETRMEGLCEQGPYSALTSAEEKLAQLEQEEKRENLRVEAVRLLRETVATCRTEAIAAVSKPVEAVASKILQHIAGPRLGRIQIGDSFEPVAVVPEAVEQAVTLDNLSGGEQEQLYLATRLALAEVLAKHERQLLVLDDVLMATDTPRLTKALNILEEATQRLQILLLTCHPENYRVLKNVPFFDLESLVRKAAGG